MLTFSKGVLKTQKDLFCFISRFKDTNNFSLNFFFERVTRIELASSAWKANALAIVLYLHSNFTILMFLIGVCMLSHSKYSKDSK